MPVPSHPVLQISLLDFCSCHSCHSCDRRRPVDHGANLLYLALAYCEWHQFDDARKIIALLGRNNYADRMLMSHEVRLYNELRETLNSQ